MAQERVDLGVSLPAAGALACVIGAFLALAACVGAERGDPPLPVFTPVVERNVAQTPAAQAARQRAWRDAAALALERPTPVELPHAEWGGFRAQEPNARGIAFVADAGQIIEINLARPEGTDADATQDSNPIDVELFLLDTRGIEPAAAEQGAGAHEVRLAHLPPGDSSLRFRLPFQATYVVRLTPAPLSDAIYFLKLELGAALPSPLRGYEVKSFFGASRDHGKRHHEGVDIFAPRSTPVLAVADGRATYRENKLGGHGVWLATSSGVSYYYAHLERAAVGSGQRVRVGDVVGYVGDSGNAATVGPHLHFGVFRWGQGAVDPMPLLQSRKFPRNAFGEKSVQHDLEVATTLAAGALDGSATLAAGCAGRPPATLTAFKRCTAAELLKQRPYSATGANCPDIAPPCMRMAELQEPPFTQRGAVGLEAELALPAAAPVQVQLAAAVLELPVTVLSADSLPVELEARSFTQCNESADGLPGLCATRAPRHAMVF